MTHILSPKTDTFVHCPQPQFNLTTQGFLIQTHMHMHEHTVNAPFKQWKGSRTNEIDKLQGAE